MTRLPSPSSGEERHEALFLQRYDWLLRRALALTDYVRPLAEDLVHDACVQFAMVRPDLQAIENLDAYLAGMLRKLHLSTIRRVARARHLHISIADFDSLEVALRAAPPDSLLQVREDLLVICLHACQRMPAAKSASVLVLRFFHGYYPGEIAQIAGISARAVDERLRVAREEARACLLNPGRFGLVQRESSAATDLTAPAPDFAAAIRRTLVRNRHLDCEAPLLLRRRYADAKRQPLETARLAHLAGCPRCLDHANRALGLPVLAERYPTEMLGSGRRHDGDDPPADHGAPGTPDERAVHAVRRRLRDTIEHRPKELRVTVNGRLLSTQPVCGDVTTLALRLPLEEPIGFAEVWSEQDVRLLFLDVEPPPSGAAERRARVTFTDGRTLDVRLVHDGDRPTLSTTYRDPQQAAQPTGEAVMGSEPEDPIEAGRVPPRSWRTLLSFLWTAAPPPFLRAFGIAILVLACAAAGFWYWSRLPSAAVSAAELLDRAARAEAASTADPSHGLHRVLHLRTSTAAAVGVRRLETWRAGARTARRLFSGGEVVAGEWVTEHGVTLFELGQDDRRASTVAPARTPRPPILTTGSPSHSLPARDLLLAGDAWRLDPGPALFRALAATGTPITLKDDGGIVELGWTGDTAHPGFDVASMTLRLRRTDLMTVEMSLSLAREPGLEDLRWEELSLERVPVERVPAAVWLPDPAPNPMPTAAPAPRVTAPALDELELEATLRLHLADACLGDGAELTRHPSHLEIAAVVSDAARQRSLVAALGPLASNPAIRVRISTLASAAASSPPRAVTFREIELSSARLPVFSMLRAYFNAGATDGRNVDPEVFALAGRVVERSHRAAQHVWALEQLGDRYPPGRLTGSDYDTWVSMVRDHAAAAAEQLEMLRLQVSPYFRPAAEPGASPGEEDGATHARMRALAKADRWRDEVIRRDFTASTDTGSSPLQVTTTAFWREFARAERLAASLAREGR